MKSLRWLVRYATGKGYPWQLAGRPLETMAVQTGLHTDVLGLRRSLDPQLGLHVVCVWIPDLCYTQALGGLIL